MKYLFSLCLLGGILLSSCSNEGGFFINLYEEHQTVKTPNNPRNPYDSIGESYVRVIQKLQVLGVSAPGVSSKEITIQNRMIQADSTVHSIEDLWDVINQSHLSISARETLIDFISTVLEFDPNDYNPLYTYIVDFEVQVLDSDVFTAEDQRVILGFSSIIRFVAFQDDFVATQSEGDDKDEEEEDWDMTVPDMVGWFLAVLNNDFALNQE